MPFATAYINASTSEASLPFGEDAVSDICAHLNPLLADVFALYMKTKNFHWHMSGPHFRDYHLMLDEQGQQIFAITDDIAERVRKIGGTTLRSISDVVRFQRLADNELPVLTAEQMLAELKADNLRIAAFMLDAHDVCDQYRDVATASLLGELDRRSAAQRRAWFLAEASC